MAPKATREQACGIKFREPEAGNTRCTDALGIRSSGGELSPDDRQDRTKHPAMKTVPAFKSRDEIYHADGCRPLVEAAALGTVKLESVSHGHYPGKVLPPAALPGLKMAGYWDAIGDQNWGLPWHRNEGIELTFLDAGSLVFEVDGKQHALRPDDMTITRPWQQHRIGNPYVTASHLDWIIVDVGVRRPNQDWKWPPWLILSQPDLDDLTDILHHNEQPVWTATPAVRRSFRAVAHALECDREGSSISRLALSINDLFLSLIDLLRSRNVRLDRSLSSSRRAVRLFLQYLQEAPDRLAADLTLEEMAKSCGLGATQFASHVRSLTNLSPMRYVTRCRLEYAARLLREQPAAPVTEVALTSGFSSSQYFATVFSQHFGCSPREFRSKADFALAAAGQ